MGQLSDRSWDSWQTGHGTAGRQVLGQLADMSYDSWKTGPGTEPFLAILLEYHHQYCQTTVIDTEAPQLPIL